MTRTTAKQTVQPSKVMGFAPTVAIERSLYKAGLVDDPNFWNSEYGFLHEDSGGDAATKPPELPWYEKLVNVYGAYQAQRTAQKMQDQLARENAARASRGNAPLSMDQYAKYASPQVNVGLSPAVQNILIYGGLGLAGILILGMVMKRR